MTLKRSSRPTMGFDVMDKAVKLLLDSVENKNTGCLECSCGKHASGYGWVSASKVNWLAHRLVWVAFRGEIPTDKIIIHSCDNRACIRLDHLRIGTFRDNNLDCVNRGRWKWGRKTVKLSPEQVLQIKDKYCPRKYTQQKLADEYGVTQTTIKNIVNNLQWGHISRLQS